MTIFHLMVWRGVTVVATAVFRAVDWAATRAGGIEPDAFDYSYEGKP